MGFSFPARQLPAGKAIKHRYQHISGASTAARPAEKQRIKTITRALLRRDIARPICAQINARAR